MVKRKEELQTIINQNMKGGQGEVEVTHIASSDELNNKTKMYARLNIKEGSSLGFHTHIKEMEVIYILKGEANYNDGENIIKVKEGDVCICKDGHGHSIAATKDLELIANIIYL